MEPLLKQLGELPKRLGALPSKVRWLLFGGIAVVAGIVAMMQLGAGSSSYEYAFTNLSPEDAAEAAGQLKAAKIPFKMEAGGTALAVPSTQVYDARLMLAASGLPRGAGVGFEIFDRGDLGVSEFTQRVNLKRAIEGELARTIGHLAAVRSARVHITLPEKGLYRDDDRTASAAVVLNLQPGRTLADKEVSGIRHLVSSSVPGLVADKVTLVDGHGSVLAGDEGKGREADEQRAMERSLEQRIVELLEPAVGAGAVVAKVSAAVDSSDVETTSDAYDPESAAVRSEHHLNELIQSDSGGPAGLAGAAANQPLGGGVPGGPASGARGQTNREDETKNYEISKTVTRTLQRGPRLKKLSVAVLLEAPSDKPRAEAEIARLTALAKSAVGFDVQRGDQFELSTSAFQRKETAPEAKLAFLESPWIMRGARIAGALLLLLIVAVALSRMRGAGAPVQTAALAAIRPGSKLAEAEAALANAGALPPGESPAVAQLPPSDPNAMVRDRARELARQDPQRAAQLLKAWINADAEQRSS
jgi:flagellar M-ring protein FliF